MAQHEFLLTQLCAVCTFFWSLSTNFFGRV